MKNDRVVLLFLVSGCLVIPSCKKVEKEMAVTTGDVTEITITTAKVSGTIIDLGEGSIQYGHCYSKTKNPTVSGTKTELGIPAELVDFTSILSNLDPSTTYYVKAYMSNGNDVVYGSEVTFITKSDAKPILTTTSISALTTNSASSGGEITNEGGTPVNARGICWSTSPNPTIEDNIKSEGTGTGSFLCAITGLTTNTTYYVRAYATNEGGTSYGNQQNFTTLAIVTTNAISYITTTTAFSGGSITVGGGADISARGICRSTNQNPTIADNKTTDGTGTGNFTSGISGLTANTTYHIRAYATNEGGTVYGNQQSFTTYITNPSTIVDVDGNTYNVAQIGFQMWIKDNLKTTKFKSGTSISEVTDNTIWTDATFPAYCWYNNDAPTYKATYGALYNAYTVSTGNLCPTGWHVPTQDEWTILITYLGGDLVAGGKMKEIGTTHWLSPNTGATNESGFTALPGGGRTDYEYAFSMLTTGGYWWSSSGNHPNNWWNLRISNDWGGAFQYAVASFCGRSVRCVKD